MGEKKSREWYDKFLTPQRLAMFNSGVHVERAKALASLVAAAKSSVIFEFAAGGSILCSEILSLLPKASYTWSDFSISALEHAQKQLAACSFFPNNRRRVSFHNIDIDAGYHNINFENVDAVVCVSLEHLEHDREILQSLPKGKKVFLSIPNIDAEDHIRVLKTPKEIQERYGDILDIKTITPCAGLFHLVCAERK